MELRDILRKAYELGGSDIFIIPGAHVTCKVKGDMKPLTDDIVKPAGSESLVREAYEMAHRDIAKLHEEGDDDFSFALAGLSRFRCNAYVQRGTVAATCRMVAFGLPDPRSLGIPDLVMELTKNLNVAEKKVLFVVTESNLNVSLSCRNLPNVKVINAASLNTYDVMNASAVVMFEGAVNAINEMLA